MRRLFSPKTSLLLAGILVLLLSARSILPNESTEQRPPDPLETFEIEPGFQIELIAQEPLLADPVAMEVDEAGRVYVLEMPGYPLDVEATGRVRLLTDTDGDGVLDESAIYADGLVLPTGLMRWKNGILVTAPPDVIFLEDTDGDLQADRREIVLTGFARSNPQHNFNKPLYGLDNWIYVANNGIIHTTAYADVFGDAGSEVHFPARPGGVRLGRNGNDRNVRFKPDSFELESLAGRSQFGQTFDAWGHHFLVDNSHPQYHEVIAARYLARNPRLSPRLAMNYTPTYGRNAAIFPITRDPEHQLLTDRGMITSAAGITYYLGGLFPEAYQDISIVGEPVHNLVHVLKVHKDGPTFRAERIHERKEFLASTDGWFRPVNFYVGPDGALYVIDYYRQIVEHPEWMDEETAHSGKLQNGTDMGRLYRITPSGTPPAAWMNALDLNGASVETLVSHLDSPNTWWRRTAQRLLVGRQDAAAAPHLKRLFDDGTRPEARLHALWTLEGLHALDAGLIQTALLDPHPGVRENAIILAENHVTQAPGLWNALILLEEDPDARVRFQLLCTLGFLDTPTGQAIRQRLLTRDIDDAWIQLAALSAREDVDLEFLTAQLPTLTARDTDGRREFLQRIAGLIASGGSEGEISSLYDLMLSGPSEPPDWWRLALMQGTAEGIRSAALPAAAQTALRNHVLQTFSQVRNSSLRGAGLAVLEARPGPFDESVESVLPREVRLARDVSLDAALRAQAIALLALYAADRYREDFQALLVPSEPQDVQLAATRALGKSADASLPEFLLGQWHALTPVVRNAALDQMMRTQSGMAALLDAVSDGVVQPSAIGWNRTVRLMRDTDGALRNRARELLSEPPGVREQIVESYYASLDLEGDVEAGGRLFERTCGVCHQVAGMRGTAFGPDLGTVRHWSARALLAKILMPQRTIADGYGLWSVEKKDGSIQTGIIAAESPAAITVRQQGQAPITIPRNEILNLENLNVSAMPAGLETQLSKQQMADLIAFLRFN